MKTLHIDLETYSSVNLAKSGLHFYSRHPSTQILLFAFAYGDEKPQIVDLKNGEIIPKQVLRDLICPKVLKWAHNASFEVEILKNVLKLPIEVSQWRCTMIWAFYLSLPGGLDKLSQLMKLSHEEGKMREGKKLISLFSIPTEKTPSPEDWENFKNYCLQDVIAERKVQFHLSKYPLPDHEWEFFALDQKINSEGLPIDTELTYKMKKIVSQYKENLEDETKKTTLLENPNSRNQLLEWLQNQGLEISDLKKETVEKTLADPKLESKIKTVLKYRQEASRSSLAKLDTIIESVSGDGRLRGSFQFYGAGRTGRFAGRRFQPQNIPRPVLSSDEIRQARKHVKVGQAWVFPFLYADVTKTLSSLLRSIIAAPKRKSLVVSDFASIESIILAWICEDEDFIRSFVEGKDPYKNFASKIFQKPYEEISKTERNLAKPAVLGCGYGLGSTGLQRYAEIFGLILSDDEAEKQVALFRSTYHKIPKFWSKIWDGIFHSLAHPHTQFSVGKFVACFDGKFLSLELPSKRKLFYYQPRIETGPWNRPQLTYMGRQLDLRVNTHPGKLVENLTQAVARDVLIEALAKVDQAGLTIIGHVHDEIICLESQEEAEKKLKQLNEIMRQPPDWGPDLPLKSDGYTNDFYQK